MAEIVDLTSPKDADGPAVQPARRARTRRRRPGTTAVTDASREVIDIPSPSPVDSTVIDLLSDDDGNERSDGDRSSSLEPLNGRIAEDVARHRRTRAQRNTNSSVSSGPTSRRASLDDILVLVKSDNHAGPSQDDSDIIVVEKENQNSTKLVIGPDGEVDNDHLTPKRKALSCPICMDHERTIRRTGRQLMSTTCGHIYCSDCIKQSLETMKCCPTCRKKLNKKTGIHPIFV